MFWTDNSANTLPFAPPSGLIPMQPPELLGHQSSTVRTIAFVDAQVADAATVMANIQADVKILLDSNQDGIGQITTALSHYQNLTGIEIISHGDVATVQLGKNSLDATSLSQYAPQIQQWHNSLTAGADILFYGCNIAAGAIGESFISKISNLTGADVAASTNMTGNSAKGGDWQLEYSTGKIETSNPFTTAWTSTYQSLFANQLGMISAIGIVKQKQTLTANVVDGDGLGGVSIKYQWQQSSNHGDNWTNIIGATSKKLTLEQAQVNNRVRATATYTDALGNLEQPISSATAVIANVNDVGRVILKGSATVGGTLTEAIVDADGVGNNVNYVWQQRTNGSTWTNISGATNKSLALNNSFLGKQVRVRTNYTDAFGTNENVVSLGATITAENAIVLENQQPGTTAWQISDADLASNNEIAGYGAATSINKGQALDLKISLAQPGKYAVEVYRSGYYNGDGGRYMSGATGLNGVTQAAPTIDPTTRLVECNWNTSYTVQTGANWTSGLYLAKLIDSSTGKQSLVEFTVRDDGRPAELGFQESATTAAAYNNYGGYSSYGFNSLNGQAANKVSFDRPLSTTTNGILAWEYQSARWLESQGYDLSYYTNLDVQTNPYQLYSQKAFLSLGHDEYWSLEMRNNVEKARDNGTNLAFFSANSAYWRVRFEPSSTGTANRTMAIYKDDWELDPVAQQDNSKATNQFRSPQINRPENALLGVMYTGYINDTAAGFDFVVSKASDAYYAKKH